MVESSRMGEDMTHEPGIPPSQLRRLEMDCAEHGEKKGPKYRTIVVDPPWAYEDKLIMGRGKDHRGAATFYRCESLDDIAAIPVGTWAEEAAHLYVWTTNAFMVEAHELARVWGFRQRTILTWCKTQFGMGHYFRNSTEHVLFCVRGSLPTSRKDKPTHFAAPRGRHSEKPAAFYDLVESMSPGPYLDVFNRKQRLGWDAWGLEAYTPEGLPEPVR